MNEEERELLIALTTDWHLKAEVVRMHIPMNTSPDGEVRLKHEIARQIALTEERIAHHKLRFASETIVGRATLERRPQPVAKQPQEEVGSGPAQ